MSWNEPPPAGLYVVLALVMAWCAILTNELREVRTGKRFRDQMEQARHLQRFAGIILNIARLGLIQLVIFLVAAAGVAIYRLETEGGLRNAWEIGHLTLHLIVVLSLYRLLKEWLDKGQLNPRSRYL